VGRNLPPRHFAKWTKTQELNKIRLEKKSEVCGWNAHFENSKEGSKI